MQKEMEAGAEREGEKEERGGGGNRTCSMTRPSAPFFCSLLLLVLISFVDFSSGTCFALSLSLSICLCLAHLFTGRQITASPGRKISCALSLCVCVCVSCGSCVSRRRTCRVRLAQELQFWPQNGHTHRHESDLHTQGTHTQKAHTQLRHSYSHTHVGARAYVCHFGR